MNRIKMLRLKQNLKQDELAKVTGISLSSISAYERGVRHPKYEQWQKLADYFGVSVPYLQGLTDLSVTDEDFHQSSRDTDFENPESEAEHFKKVLAYHAGENVQFFQQDLIRIAYGNDYDEALPAIERQNTIGKLMANLIGFVVMGTRLSDPEYQEIVNLLNNTEEALNKIFEPYMHYGADSEVGQVSKSEPSEK